MKPKSQEDLRSKIFVIGLQRTGTSSMGRALELMGNRVCGAVGCWWPEIGRVHQSLARIIVDQYDAFQDNPWPVNYREMSLLFPDSHFILTTRHPTAWVKSMRKYFKRGLSPFEKWYFKVSSIEEISDAELVFIYKNHISSVIEFFKDTPERLTFFRTGEDNWDVLNKVPRWSMRTKLRIYPHVNSWVKDGEKKISHKASCPQPDEGRLREELGLIAI